LFASTKINFNLLSGYTRTKINLGYDRNLIDAFNIVDSEYVFLLSDDDYVVGDKIADLLQMLEKREFNVYFTPYTRDDGVNRLPPKGGRFENFDPLDLQLDPFLRADL